MADNVSITPGSGAKAASREVAYSGETAQAQVVGLVTFAGADDAKTVADVGADNPLPVRLDLGPEGIISSNGSLQVDATQVNEQSAKSLNATNVALLGDEPVQMVGLHPSYPLPIDTATPLQIGAKDVAGNPVGLALDFDGKIIPADSVKILYLESPPNHIASFNGPTFQFDALGYKSVIFDFTNGSSSAPFQIQQSIDGVTWYVTNGFSFGTLAVVTLSNIINTSATYAIPVWGRYFRVRYENTTAPGFRLFARVYLRRADFSLSSISQFPATQSVNVGQINGAAVAATSAQLGVNAFGPTAPGAAHSTNNPVQMSGSDGTNVRRILTDTSGNTRVVGPLAAGTSTIPPTNAAFAPDLMGIADLEGRVQRATGDVRGRQAVTLPDATAADDGIIDALNNVVRELKLLNAKITDLPYWLGINSVMPDDGQSFRDDRTLFNQ